MAPLMSIFYRYPSNLPSDERFHVHSLVSNFNIVDAVLCKIDKYYIESGNSAVALSKYLRWVLAESEVRRSLSIQSVLLTVLFNLEREFIAPSSQTCNPDSNLVCQSVSVSSV